ncbi:uncharacterized protein LOC130664237 [Microplitis mediator]|uniref:uncharacterized protein LOC130664237 n=1 Tax=Microplitis mediator TaxID=375433 RepID=UPI002554B220|nr:uncharacterized protein LOC130664237 [Microplitis mediator]
MADVDSKETKVVASPEKKIVEEEKKKEVTEEEVNENSRSSETENGGDSDAKKNGSTEDKETDEKEVASTENGDSPVTPVEEDVCSIKRKSTAGSEAVDATDGVAPEKKAKVDDKPVVEAESNGDAKTAA